MFMRKMILSTFSLKSIKYNSILWSKLHFVHCTIVHFVIFECILIVFKVNNFVISPHKLGQDHNTALNTLIKWSSKFNFYFCCTLSYLYIKNLENFLEISFYKWTIKTNSNWNPTIAYEFFYQNVFEYS